MPATDARQVGQAPTGVRPADGWEPEVAVGAVGDEVAVGERTEALAITSPQRPEEPESSRARYFGILKVR